MELKRIYPRRTQDKHYLSRLFDALLQALEEGPMQLQIRTLSYDTQVPERVLLRLRRWHQQPDDSDVRAADFHLLFSLILTRYPTVKMFELPDGSFFFEM